MKWLAVIIEWMCTLHVHVFVQGTFTIVVEVLAKIILA